MWIVFYVNILRLLYFFKSEKYKYITISDYSVLAKIAPIKKTKTVESQYMYRRVDKHRHSFANIINYCHAETMLLYIYKIFFTCQRK